MMNTLLIFTLFSGLFKSTTAKTLLEQHFPDYEFRKGKNMIGKGASSKAYLVNLKTDKRKDFVLRETMCDNRDSVNRANAEFQMLKKLDHPNIIKLISTEELVVVSKRCMTILESGDFGNLRKSLEAKKPVFPNDLSKLNLIFGIAKGLKELKDNKIIHRDLKPDNIVLSAQLEPKIIDFDLAVNEPGLYGVRGTPVYIDPELIDLGRYFCYSNVDYSVDVYGLGILLFEITFNERPFNQRTMGKLFDKIIISQYRIKECNPFIAFLIFHMMARKKENRPTIEQALKWIVFAIRWTENVEGVGISPTRIPNFADNLAKAKRNKTVSLMDVNGKEKFPEKGWRAMGVDFVPVANSFLDLENSGLLVKFDWGLASYIKDIGISQNTKLTDIPAESDVIPTELKELGPLDKFKNLFKRNSLL